MSLLHLMVIAFLVSSFIGTHNVCVGLGITVGILIFIGFMDQMGWLD